MIVLPHLFLLQWLPHMVAVSVQLLKAFEQLVHLFVGFVVVVPVPVPHLILLIQECSGWFWLLPPRMLLVVTTENAGVNISANGLMLIVYSGPVLQV
ncbi:hypothetical protein Hdeb2414_s0140g00810891 [Helianthus debilis subsp. tardiflorus]